MTSHLGRDGLGHHQRVARDRDIGFKPVVDDRNAMRLTVVITDRDIAILHAAEGHNGGCTV